MSEPIYELEVDADGHVIELRSDTGAGDDVTFWDSRGRPVPQRSSEDEFHTFEPNGDPAPLTGDRTDDASSAPGEEFHTFEPDGRPADPSGS